MKMKKTYYLNKDVLPTIPVPHDCIIKKIRIEPCSRLVTAKDNRQVSLSAVLFYDCKNSRPKNQIFSQGQKVIWNGTEHIIETIEPLYDDNKLHHYELGLI